jgi:hypothetical protein
MDIINGDHTIDAAAGQMQGLVDHARQAAFALNFRLVKNTIRDAPTRDAITDITHLDAMLTRYLIAHNPWTQDTK